MDLAIVLAKKGGGNVNPNPQVGALIVKEGELLVKVIMKIWESSRGNQCF